MIIFDFVALAVIMAFCLFFGSMFIGFMQAATHPDPNNAKVVEVRWHKFSGYRIGWWMWTFFNEKVK